MKLDIRLQIPPDAVLDRMAVQQLIEAEIHNFEEWFAQLEMDGTPNGPLTNAERAILSTFLVWRLRKNEG